MPAPPDMVAFAESYKFGIRFFCIRILEMTQ